MEKIWKSRSQKFKNHLILTMPFATRYSPFAPTSGSVFIRVDLWPISLPYLDRCLSVFISGQFPRTTRTASNAKSPRITSPKFQNTSTELNFFKRELRHQNIKNHLTPAIRPDRWISVDRC
jgi:hypothetical protein